MTNINKTILVTGGAGFIGTNFIYHTLKSNLNWRIVNLDALTYSGNIKNFEILSQELRDRYKFVHGSICDQNLLVPCLKGIHVE